MRLRESKTKPLHSGKYVLSFFPALFLTLNLFLFLPLAIYQGNLEEFDVALSAIFVQFLIPAALLLVVLTALGLILPLDGRRRFASPLFAVAVLIWIQGNLIVWKYGTLTGQNIEWKKHVLSGWVDSGLWIVVLILAVIFSRAVSKIAVSGSIIFICIQFTSGAYSIIRKPGVCKAHSSISIPRLPPQGVFEFSAQQNVLQCILDGFQSNFFKEILSRDPSKYENELDGFTFFEEATGTFPSTQMSVPAFLSGEVYKNEIPTRKFLEKIAQGRTIGNILNDHGFDVDLVTGLIFTKKARCTTRYSIAVPYGVTRQQYYRTNSAQMLDLALFRAAPQPLKRLIYNDENWLFQLLLGGGSKRLYIRLFSHRAFVDDLIQRMSVSREKAVYKYIHLMTSHPPIFVDDNCRFVPALPNNLKNRVAQARCALDQFLRLLGKLRSSGIYDSAMIILQADHGAGEEIIMVHNDGTQGKDSFPAEMPRIASLALPLLAVKPPYARGPIKISKAPVALTDLPATILSILGIREAFDGRNIFEVDQNEKRTRKFYYYDWSKTNWDNEYFDGLYEFDIAGNPYDRNSWRMVRSFDPPVVSLKTHKIDFGSPQSRRFKRSGWGGNQKDPVDGTLSTWALGESATLFLSLPKDRLVYLTARIKSKPFDNPQVITIRIDNKTVGKWILDAPWDMYEKTLIIPQDPIRPGRSTVEFLFSQHLDSTRGLGSQAVLFQWIKIHPLN